MFIHNEQVSHGRKVQVQNLIDKESRLSLIMELHSLKKAQRASSVLANEIDEVALDRSAEESAEILIDALFNDEQVA